MNPPSNDPQHNVPSATASTTSALRGTTIWLTGASSGIGRALAIELGRRGARLAITARNATQLQEVVEIIKSANGTASSYPGDVQNLEQLKEITARIASDFGAPIDMLIANAGTHIETHPEKFDSKEYLFIMDLNFGGMLRSIEAVLPSMLSRKRGHIVGVASLAGFRGLPRAGAYGASKSAMIHFLESVRYHLVRQGLFVTIVNPGFVKTPLTDKNDFKMPFLTSAEKAATIIADGLEKKRKDISFPIPFSWFLKLARIIPYPIYERIVERLW